jgi:hypothetical protein
MRRIYFMVPDIKAAKKIVDQLLLARIEERHLHVLAKRGTPLGNLPEAGVLQKSDFVAAVERAVPLGGAAGVLAGLVAIAMPGGGPVVAGGVLLGSALAGVGVGAWLGGMVGMNVGNTRLKQFEDAIERGELLVMADVATGKVDEIENEIRKHLPNVRIEGTEPHIPAFP